MVVVVVMVDRVLLQYYEVGALEMIALDFPLSGDNSNGGCGGGLQLLEYSVGKGSVKGWWWF